MKNAPIALINTAAASGTVSSNGIYLANIIDFSIHAYSGAGGTGSIVIQVSNDNVIPNGTSPNAASNVVNWTPVASGTISISGTGSSMLNFADAGYLWMRAVYTASGGTSALNVNYFGKGP